MVDSLMPRNALGRFVGRISLAAASLAVGCLLLASPVAGAAEAPTHGEEGHGVDWSSWKAGNELSDKASLQRGATNFMNYCQGCHSLKYLRYERVGKDLSIPAEQLRKSLIPASAKPTDYIVSTFPAADGEAWFGRAPPDLSLITRSKGSDYVFQFLKTFYVDESKPTKTNNLALDGAAMPAVLSDLEGVKRVVFGTGEASGHGGGKPVERFEQVAPGQLTPAQYDAFVRDTVNFLQYAGEPTQVEREGLGIWVVLFLLVFTWFAWLLKREYWKDVR
jgi:ubiquinol-cytochrome c reductase cytochrome c1 subunit